MEGFSSSFHHYFIFIPAFFGHGIVAVDEGGGKRHCSDSNPMTQHVCRDTPPSSSTEHLRPQQHGTPTTLPTPTPTLPLPSPSGPAAISPKPRCGSPKGGSGTRSKRRRTDPPASASAAKSKTAAKAGAANPSKCQTPAKTPANVVARSLRPRRAGVDIRHAAGHRDQREPRGGSASCPNAVSADGWCAVSDLRYSEIGDIAAAVATLQEHAVVRVHGVTCTVLTSRPTVSCRSRGCSPR